MPASDGRDAGGSPPQQNYSSYHGKQTSTPAGLESGLTTLGGSRKIVLRKPLRQPLMAGLEVRLYDVSRNPRPGRVQPQGDTS